LSTLYIRLPSRVAADSAPQWLELVCPFALVAHGGAIEREGVAPLSNLVGTVAEMQRVVLLLAGSDVTLLRVQVPPLSAARLKAALPNLVEERLLCDPAGCVIVAGGLSDGLRTIAVVQRAWLDLLTSTFIASGARHIAALPAQSCLHYLSDKSGQPGQPGMVIAAISQRDNDIDLTLRFSEQDGIGLAINVEPDGTAAHEVIHTLFAVVPAAPVTLYVPQAAVRAYQEAVADTPALKERISVSADNWTHWIAGARGAALDLMAGQGANTGFSLDWRSWRWPLALGAAVLLINVSALNIGWWRMKSEAASLRSSMIQTYKSAYPNESVIIDPIAQMQQKIAAAKRDSGLPAPDDFTAITAAFGEAWASVTATLATPPSIAALEYRERSLLVRLKPVPSRVEGLGGEAPAQQMKAVLAGRGLSLELAPAQPGAVVWQIRSVK
jgi:general secretion pathway protein L